MVFGVRRKMLRKRRVSHERHPILIVLHGLGVYARFKPQLRLSEPAGI